MATGDLSLSVRADGWSVDLTVAGFALGATYNFALSATNDATANTPSLAVLSEGYAGTTLGTVARTVYLTKLVRMPTGSKAIAGTFSGTFTDGETITQATSGATAKVYGSGQTTTHAALIAHTFTGTPDATHVWTGGTSGATLTPSGAPVARTYDERVVSSNLVARVSLSAPVYADDKSGGAGTSGTNPTLTAPAAFVTNAGGASQTSNAATAVACTVSSTLTYPKVVGRWAWPGYDRVTADFLLEAVAFHAHGVAAVAFDASDASAHSAAQQVVTAMTLSANDTGSPALATGSKPVRVSTYSATMSVSALTDGDVLTGRFRAYPRVGDASAVLDSETGVTPPSPALCPLKLWLDKANTRAVYVVCDAAQPDDTAGQASGTLSVAEAHRFKSIAGALTAGAVLAGTSDGVVCYLVTGDYAQIGNFDGGNAKAWQVVTPHPTLGTRAGCRITTGGAYPTKNLTKYLGITLETSANFVHLCGGTGSFWIGGCVINLTGTEPLCWAAVAYATNNTITALSGGLQRNSGDACPYGVIRGNNSAAHIAGETSCLLGNNKIFPANVADNAVIAFNPIYAFTSGTWFAGSSYSPSDGIALVCNLVERTGSDTLPLIQIGDSGTTTSNNVIQLHNTVVGQRLNEFYNDSGATSISHANATQGFNSFNSLAVKTDTFTGGAGGANAARTGNWSVVYGVNSRGNRYEGDSSFNQDFPGLDSVVVATAAYTLDASRSGADTGNGDYSPGSGSSLRNRIPASGTVIPFDIVGTPYGPTGNGSAGALQRAADLGRGTNVVMTSGTLTAGGYGIRIGGRL